MNTAQLATPDQPVISNGSQYTHNRLPVPLASMYYSLDISHNSRVGASPLVPRLSSEVILHSYFMINSMECKDHEGDCIM